MLTTSAALALVLHLPPHPLPRQPIPHVYNPSTSASARVRGDLSPWPVLSQPSAPMVALETGNPRQQRPAQNPPEPNLDQILPGGAFAPAGSSVSTPNVAAPPPPQPTYESWDVLRQYPHTAPLAPPASAPAGPDRSTKSPSLEKHDVQTPQTPSP